MLDLVFFTGVFLATFSPLSLPTITWLLGLGAILLLLQKRIKGEENYAVILIGLSLSIVFFALGALRIDVALWHFAQSELKGQVGELVELQGLVVTEPDVRERVTYLTVKTSGERILVSVDPFKDVSYGDVVNVKGKLTVPDSFETELGRTFHYGNYLKARGILYQVPFAHV